MRARTLVKWHGGKGRLASWIIERLPPSRVYVEPYGGGAAVLLNKPASEVEVYNDLDGRIANLFRVLRDQPLEFWRKIDLVPYSEAEFESAKALPPWTSDLDRAVGDYVRFRQSFGGSGQCWSYGRKRAVKGRVENVNAWLEAIDGLPALIARVKSWQVFTRPALEIIRTFDDTDAVIYCDPPYVSGTRTSPDKYAFEMNDQAHAELAKALKRCKAKVAVSGYPSPLYDELFKGWRCEQREVANHSSGGCKKRAMTEALWMNYPKRRTRRSKP